VKTTNEVIFRARNLDAVRAYYAGRLGYTVVLEKDGMIGFDTGAFNVYFERGEPNGAVFEVEADDVQRAKHELIAEGCELVEENPAIPRVYVRDPFGLTYNISKS
jgi:catechol 2,3-dioxygenase-like lactoylglutathione lyase family enzyme